jgi:hypothetical protein
MAKTVDRFIIDPPFLSEDCQTKGISCSNILLTTIRARY